MYLAKKQNQFVTTFHVITNFRSMVLYVNVNVNIHVTVLLEHTFYCITFEGSKSLQTSNSALSPRNIVIRKCQWKHPRNSAARAYGLLLQTSNILLVLPEL